MSKNKCEGFEPSTCGVPLYPVELTFIYHTILSIISIEKSAIAKRKRAICSQSLLLLVFFLPKIAFNMITSEITNIITGNNGTASTPTIPIASNNATTISNISVSVII